MSCHICVMCGCPAALAGTGNSLEPFRGDQEPVELSLGSGSSARQETCTKLLLEEMESRRDGDTAMALSQLPTPHRAGEAPGGV